MDLKTLLIAGAAGIACVMVIAASQSAGVAGIPLLLLAPLSIYVAALAWGTLAAILSCVVAIVVAFVAVSPGMAAFVACAFAIPAAVIGHQANLAQQTEDGQVEWFPLSQLLFNLTLALAFGIVIVGYVAGYNIETLTPPFMEAFKEMFKVNPPPVPLNDEELQQLVERTLNLMPFIATSVWVIVHVVNLHLSAKICRASGKLPRPKDDLAQDASMPSVALAIMIAALVGAVMLSGPAQMVAGVFAGAFVTAFALVGLASIHLRARNNAAGFVFLMLTYALILFFYFPLFLYAIGGVIRTLNPNTNTPPSAGNTLS